MQRILQPLSPQERAPTLAELAHHRRLTGYDVLIPEAQLGGPIALVKDGDKITIDAIGNTITVDISDDEMARRRAAWKAPPLKATQGILYKYIKCVKSASEGCVTDE